MLPEQYPEYLANPFQTGYNLGIDRVVLVTEIKYRIIHSTIAGFTVRRVRFILGGKPLANANQFGEGDLLTR
ncbi:hypothetical protein GCM10027347_54760 [Larkinella harenae]